MDQRHAGLRGTDQHARRVYATGPRVLHPCSSVPAMRVAVDGRHLAAGRGVPRYTRSLLAALAERFPGDDLRIVSGSRARFAAAALTGRPRLDRMAGGADVVWLPAPAPVAVARGVPLVLTVHDLSWEQRPGDFTAYELLWHRLARIPALARRADTIVTDTRVTADAVTDRWGVDPARVSVIRPGPGLGAPAGAAVPGPAPPSHLLAVGALEPRKAPELLARAHARARAAGLRAELVYVGAGRIDVAGDGVRVVAAATDEELRRLYAGALAVVHPALLEGFGFPPVEALAHGVPAIVADLPVYAETVGAGALRVPPGDEEALAAALLRIEREPALRAELVTAGRAAIAGLSWERAAGELHAVLAEAAGR